MAHEQIISLPSVGDLGLDIYQYNHLWAFLDVYFERVQKMKKSKKSLAEFFGMKLPNYIQLKQKKRLPLNFLGPLLKSLKLNLREKRYFNCLKELYNLECAGMTITINWSVVKALKEKKYLDASEIEEVSELIGKNINSREEFLNLMMGIFEDKWDYFLEESICRNVDITPDDFNEFEYLHKYYHSEYIEILKEVRTRYLEEKQAECISSFTALLIWEAIKVLNKKEERKHCTISDISKFIRPEIELTREDYDYQLELLKSADVVQEGIEKNSWITTNSLTRFKASSEVLKVYYKKIYELFAKLVHLEEYNLNRASLLTMDEDNFQEVKRECNAFFSDIYARYRNVKGDHNIYLMCTGMYRLSVLNGESS